MDNRPNCLWVCPHCDNHNGGNDSEPEWGCYFCGKGSKSENFNFDTEEGIYKYDHAREEENPDCEWICPNCEETNEGNVNDEQWECSTESCPGIFEIDDFYLDKGVYVYDESEDEDFEEDSR